MSKTKTKRARRELKREGNRKIAAHHRKVAKAADTAAKPSPSSKQQPTAKRQKTKAPTTATSTNAASTSTAPPKPQSHVQASQKHPIPFGVYDHILLVGEGDFSFTRSLAVTHGCAHVTGTSLDSATDVAQKYPTFAAIQTELAALSPPVPLHHGVDAAKLSSYKELKCVRDDEDGDGGEGWDTIAFMFPHTGGLSTDVNRQVRANQALLVSFFKACLETPTPAKRIQLLAHQRNALAPPRSAFLRMGGRIVVTLFEGEPYSLWNVRDLARHCGLRVVESWKFEWGEYEGYAHVRTLGSVETGWQGEEREARMYVFEKVPLVADEEEERELVRVGAAGVGVGSAKKGGKGREVVRKGGEGKKRKKGDSEDEDD
ncbi:hypothetical protein IQ07DRAFT_673298 [Pyrenochaeta sp. DS3sAY3a]|nr:hypothetical protein IQ07DRAFT_673298 [Pyrenochaeta sp. DS3sAY3a]